MKATTTWETAPGAELDIPRAIETPSLVIDLARVRQNLEDMANFAKENGVALAPHVKTHRTIEFAQLQTDYGAERLCVAKLSEAEHFVDAGFERLVMAYPIAGEDKYQRAIRLLAPCRPHPECRQPRRRDRILESTFCCWCASRCARFGRHRVSSNWCVTRGSRRSGPLPERPRWNPIQGTVDPRGTRLGCRLAETTFATRPRLPETRWPEWPRRFGRVGFQSRPYRSVLRRQRSTQLGLVSPRSGPASIPSTTLDSSRSELWGSTDVPPGWSAPLSAMSHPTEL